MSDEYFELAEAERNVNRLHAELRAAVKHRNAVRKSLKERCTAICASGWQCSFTMPRGHRVCTLHALYEAKRSRKATRGGRDRALKLGDAHASPSRQTPAKVARSTLD